MIGQKSIQSQLVCSFVIGMYDYKILGFYEIKKL